MTDNPSSKLAASLDLFSATRNAGAAGNLQDKAAEDTFPRDFARLKLSVIRPVFETIGNMLKERGNEFNVSEEEGGKIAIHIVPAGAKRSIHPYDWFPTLSFFGAPFTRTIGLHGRNMRPNAEPSSGTRGDYQPAQVTKELVEKELMKFIGEIANW